MNVFKSITAFCFLSLGCHQNYHAMYGSVDMDILALDCDMKHTNKTDEWMMRDTNGAVHALAKSDFDSWERAKLRSQNMLLHATLPLLLCYIITITIIIIHNYEHIIRDIYPSISHSYNHHQYSRIISGYC